MKLDGTAGGVTRFRGIMEKGRTALTALFLRRQFGQEEALRREFGRKTAFFTTRIRHLTKHSLAACGTAIKFTWACVSANVCFINWICGIGCRARRWAKRILHAKRSIKKTPGVGARPGDRSLGLGRSAFLSAWLALPDVGALGNNRSGALALSRTQKRGLFRSCAFARWPGFVPKGNRDV